MKAAAYTQAFGLDVAHREALQAAAVTAARRVFSDSPGIDRVEVYIARETQSGQERWKVVVDLVRSKEQGVLRGTAWSRRPHLAIEDACLAAWEALRASNVHAAA
jgi:hypothetical protein